MIVTCFSVFWIVTGLVFILGWVPQLFKKMVLQQDVRCDNHAQYEILIAFRSQLNCTFDSQPIELDANACLFSSFMQVTRSHRLFDCTLRSRFQPTYASSQSSLGFSVSPVP